MGYKKPIFTTNEIYHVYNRGVEKRDVFLEAADYFRLVKDLCELNDKNATPNSQYNPKRTPGKRQKSVLREPLVEILAFALMPNHYHLALRQIQDDGVVRFMQKLGTGYTNYFNKKNDRVGPLFQGSFKATHINTENYLRNLLGYIHTNPAILADNYRSSTSIIMNFLEKYRWSSFQDYLEIINFPAVTSREFILEIMGGKEGIKASAESWIVHREEKMALVPEIIEVELR